MTHANLYLAFVIATRTFIQALRDGDPEVFTKTQASARHYVNTDGEALDVARAITNLHRDGLLVR